MRNLCLFLTIILLNAGKLYAQTTPDFQEFVKETQITDSESSEITIAWWFPVEFWEIAFEKDKSLSPEAAAEFIQTIKPYVIFAVIDGKVGPMGGVRYVTSDILDRTIEVTDKDSVTYKPYNTETLPDDVENLISILGPMLKNMIGQMGENMHFYAFPDIQSNNKRIFDPRAEGKISVSFNSKVRTWETPLSTLLPMKYCPIDNKPMKGNWKFCPIHGSELKN